MENKLEYQDSKISEEIDGAFRRNVEKGLGNVSIGGSTLNQEVKDAKDAKEKDKRAKTREKYAGRNILHYLRGLRIANLSEGENRKSLSQALNCRTDQISFTVEEALSGNDIVYHNNSFCLDDIESPEDLILPLSVRWSISLRNLKSADNLIFPQSVGDRIFLQGLESIENLDLSSTIVGYGVYLSIEIYNKHKDELETKFPNLKGKFIGD